VEFVEEVTFIFFYADCVCLDLLVRDKERGNLVLSAYEEEDIATVVAALYGRALVAGCFAEVDVVVAPGGVLDWLIAGHCL
jgi:hypothetical protein